MSGIELKPCPFCGSEKVRMSNFVSYVCCESCDTFGPTPSDDEDAFSAWNTRTPDPAQIRADALREAASVASKYNKNSTIGAVTSWAITRAIIALIDTPLSPTAVDNSPSPDAGGKEGV